MRVRPLDDEFVQMSVMQIAARASATLPQTSTSTLFTISGGAIRVLGIYGEVTVVLPAGANNAKLTFDPLGAGSSIDLCATLDIAGKAVGTIFSIVGVLATAMKGVSIWCVVPANDIPAPGLRLGPGNILFDCDANKSGQVKWTLLYQKVEPNATVLVQ